MIDVEFATLGIIRCNVGDSARLHLNALGREIGRRRRGSWCFMVSCFSFSRLWLSDNNYKKQRSRCDSACNAAPFRPTVVRVQPALRVRRHAFKTHKRGPLAPTVHPFQLGFDWVMKYTSTFRQAATKSDIHSRCLWHDATPISVSPTWHPINFVCIEAGGCQ